MFSASSIAAWMDETVVSMLTTTPRRRPRDGDVPMPWTFGTAFVVARADSPGNPLDMRRRTTLHGSECQIDLEAPGHYVVFVRGVPGFEDPAPIELAVEPGNVVAIDVVVTTPR